LILTEQGLAVTISATRNRQLSLSLSGLIFLSACAAQQAANTPSLTPAEDQIHRRASQFNLTVGEGAGVGAVAGAIVGALLSKNRVQGAAIGAAAGGALGGGLGYMVASRAQAQQQTETQYNDAIAQANKDAQQATDDAVASSQVVADVRQQLVELNQRYADKQVSAEAYQAKIAELRARDRELAKIATSYEARAQGMTIYASGRQDAQEMQAAARTTKLKAEQIKADEVALSSTLGALPASPSQQVPAGA
jgi:hypothetical protein